MPAETRTEYVVFIPSDLVLMWGTRREVGRYPAEEAGEDPGEQRALEHVAYLHRLAVEQPTRASNRASAFAVKQVITVEETPLASPAPPRAPTETDR